MYIKDWIRSVFVQMRHLVDRETVGPKSLARGTETVSSVDRNGLAKPVTVQLRYEMTSE